MCIFGLLNIIYNLKFHQESDHQKPSTSLWSSSSISALALATISSVIYTILALLTYRKIHIVRMRDAKHRHTPDSEHAQLITEDEQQRRQLMRLLREHDAGRGVSPEASLSTFRIDLPEELRRSNTLLSTPDSIYEARSRLHTPISDRPVHPSMTQPIPHLFPNPFVNQNLQVQHFDPSFAPRPINMGSDYFVRGADAVPHNNDAGKPNTGYPTEKAEKVYGSSMLLVDGEQHPLERKRAHYHFETVEEQERRGRSANRENRRTEIEMGSRITSKGRAEIGIGSQNTVKDKAEIERVVVTPRIARVETDGWAPRLETASRWMLGKVFRESFGRLRGVENIQGLSRANFLVLNRNRGITLHEAWKRFTCGNSFSGVGGSCLAVDRAKVGLFWASRSEGQIIGITICTLLACP